MTAVRAALNFERNLVGRSVTEKTKAEATYRSETIRPRATYQIGRYPSSDAPGLRVSVCVAKAAIS
jgi:hypothetical protein